MAYRGFHDLLAQLSSFTSPNLGTGDPLNVSFKIGADENIVPSSVLLHPEASIERNRKNLEMLKYLLPFTGERTIYPQIEPGEHRTVPLLYPPYTTVAGVDVIDPALAIDQSQYKKPQMPELDGAILDSDELSRIIKAALSPPKIVPIFAILFKNAHPLPTVKSKTPSSDGLTDDVIDVLYSGEFTFEIVSEIANLKSSLPSNLNRDDVYQVIRGGSNWSTIRTDIKNAIIRSVLTVFADAWNGISNPKDETVRDKILEHKDLILTKTTEVIAEQLHSYFYSFGSISKGAYPNGYGPMTGSNLLIFPGAEAANLSTVNTGEDLSLHLQYNRYIYGLIVLDIILSEETTYDATSILSEPAFQGEINSYLTSVVDNYLTGIIARIKSSMGNLNSPAERTRNSFTNQTKASAEKVGPSLDRHVLIGFEIDPGKFVFPDVSLPCNYVQGLVETETPDAYRSAYILSRQPIARNVGLMVDPDNIQTFYHKLLAADKTTGEVEFGTLNSSTISNLRYSQAIFLGGVFQNRFDYAASTVYPTMTLSDGTVVTPEELAAVLKSNIFIGDCIEDKNARQPVIVILSGFKTIFFARRLLELSPEGLFVAATVDTVNSSNEDDIQQFLSYIGDAARIDEIEGTILSALDLDDINDTIKEELVKVIIERNLKSIKANDEPYKSIITTSINKYLDGDITREQIFDDLFASLQSDEYAELINDFTLDRFLDIMLRYGSIDVMDDYISGQSDNSIIGAAVEFGVGFDTLFGTRVSPAKVQTQQGPGTDAILADGFPVGELMDSGILSIVGLSELKSAYHLLKPESELSFSDITTSNISGSRFLEEWKSIFQTKTLQEICDTLFTGKVEELSSYLRKTYGVDKLIASLMHQEYGTNTSGAIGYPVEFLTDTNLESDFVYYAGIYIRRSARFNLTLTWMFEDGNPEGIPTGFTGLHSILVRELPSTDIDKIQNNAFTYTHEWFVNIMETLKEKVIMWATVDSPITKTQMYAGNKYQQSYGLMELLSILEDENTILFGDGDSAEGILLQAETAFHSTKRPDNVVVEDYRSNIGYVWIASEATTVLAEKNTTEFEKMVRAVFSIMDYLCFYCGRQDLNETWRI